MALGNYSQHVIVGTGDATFTLGDTNGDGAVDQKDRDALSSVLGSTSPQDLRLYDFNGDGAIDIIDLAVLSRNTAATGGAQLLNTTMLAPPVDQSAASKGLEDAGMTVTGQLDDLFSDNGKTVGFTASNEDPVTIPIPFSSPVEMEEIIITSPADASGVKKGRLTVEAEDGTLLEIPFDNTHPQSRAGVASPWDGGCL